LSSLLECPKQARCPGCPLGALGYEQALQSKAGRLSLLLAHYPTLCPELTPAKPATPRVHYRLRAKLVVAGARLGLFERGSHRVVDIEGCRVLAPGLSVASEALRALLPLPIYGADLRQTSEGVLVNLLTDSPQARPALQQAARALCETGQVLSVAFSLRPEGSLRLLAGKAEVLCGPADARHRLSDDAPFTYAVHGGFVQAHAGQASYVYQQIRAELERELDGLAGREVLELFAGSGTLALLLASSNAKVTAVEAYAATIDLVQRAAVEQSLHLTHRAEDAEHFLSAQNRSRKRYDAVIVNPPRRGLSPELRGSLAALAPRCVAYLSCNPETLARDLSHLAVLGLGAKRAEPLDMIPWSDAIEVLCWLTQALPPLPEVLHEDARFVAVAKPAHEPILEGKEYPGSLLARVKRLPGCQAATAVERLDTAVSGVCWFAKSPSTELALRRALASAERRYCVLVRGNLRKQGTISRQRRDPDPLREGGSAAVGEGTRAVGAGTRYKKQAELGRHSLVHASSTAEDAREVLQAFASIGHAVLGDERHGDARSNQHLSHRHGLDRPFLHCSSVELAGDEGAGITASCELTPDLAAVMRSLASD